MMIDYYNIHEKTIQHIGDVPLESKNIISILVFIMEQIDQIKNISSTSKKQLALQIIHNIIDEINPPSKDFLHTIVDSTFDKLIDTLVLASKNLLEINKKTKLKLFCCFP